MMTKTMNRTRKMKDSRNVVNEGVRVCVSIRPSTMAPATTKAVTKWETKTHTYAFLAKRGDPTR
jgi:hypothetical protein